MRVNVALNHILKIAEIIYSYIFRDEEDFEENAEVEYFLTGGNGSAFFSLDRFSGEWLYIHV